MKTLKKLLLLTVCISLFATCEPYDIFIDDEYVRVTLPFEAEFLGTYIYAGPENQNFTDVTGLEPRGCEFARVIVDFEGSGIPLGNFTGNFDFCAGPDGYGPSISYMEAENGDILYVSIEGQVIPGRIEGDHPDYVTSYWRDPFVILGGTGRYAGATGEGMSDDYNSSEDGNSHHNWSGTITLVKRR